MLRKLPGIDIPVATEAKILHAAAFLEFKQHVERLAPDGSHTAACPLSSRCRAAKGIVTVVQPIKQGSSFRGWASETLRTPTSVLRG